MVAEDTAMVVIAARACAASGPPIVRVAQLVRSSAAERGAVIVEALDARVRVTVEPGAPADTVAAVLGILVARVAS